MKQKELNDINYKNLPSIGKGYIIYENGKIYNKHNKEILGYIANNGYRTVNIKGELFLVHRILAIAFIPNPNNYKYVNHKDENKLNNDLNNLEWCTFEYNIRYSTARKIYSYDRNLNEYVYESISSISDKYNYRHVHACCKGERKSANGLIWSYNRLSKEEIIDKFNNIKSYNRKPKDIIVGNVIFNFNKNNN